MKLVYIITMTNNFGHEVIYKAFKHRNEAHSRFDRYKTYVSLASKARDFMGTKDTGEEARKAVSRIYTRYKRYLDVSFDLYEVEVE
jgi:hypothetical protein